VKNGEIVATLLGFPNVEALRASSDASFRLAYLLDLRVATPEARRVFRRVLELVVEDAVVPHATATDDISDETGRMAGFATPLDTELRERALEGFGVEDADDTVAAVHKICMRATRFLFKVIVIARGDLDDI
jgi:hypothetical protein